MFTSRHIAASDLVGQSGFTMVSEVGAQRVESVVSDVVKVAPHLIIFYVDGEWGWALRPEDMVEVLYV